MFFVKVMVIIELFCNNVDGISFRCYFGASCFLSLHGILAFDSVFALLFESTIF